MGGSGNYLAGLGARRAWTERGGNTPDAPRPECLAGHRGRAVAASYSCPVGRGIRESGAGGRRVANFGRGADAGKQNWGAVLRGGVVSIKGRANAPTIWRPQSGVRSRSVFSEGHRHSPPATSQILGAARSHEPEPPVETARQAEGSART